jgi:hypothetical protein
VGPAGVQSAMIETLILILILALVFYVLYWAVSQFVQGTPLKIVGALLAVILVLVALSKLGLINGVDL